MRGTENLLCKILALLMLAQALLLSLAVPASPSSVEILELKISIGTLTSTGTFYQRLDRTFNPGENVSIKVTLRAKSQEKHGGVIALKVALVNPLGVAIHENCRNLTLEEVGTQVFEVVFTYGLPEAAIRGYYTANVQASTDKSSKQAEENFFYNGLVDRENIVELNWTVILKGSGELKELRIAIPRAEELQQPAGPLASPKPSRIEADPLGNRYAVYENIKVSSKAFIVNFRLTALQRVRVVGEAIPISALDSLPGDVKVFLGQSQYIESNAPEIVSIARRLRQGAGTVNELAARIADYVSSRIRYNAELGSIADTWQLGALWTLHSGQGTCLQFARLYVAIARAAGLPARVVSAFDLKPPSGESSDLHAYAEVFFPGYGWVPVEPQLPGRLVGVVPPVPGYVPVIKGLGQGFGNNTPTFITMLYTGTVKADFSYTYRIYPATGIKGRVSLSIDHPRQLLFNDILHVDVSTAPRDSTATLMITAPNGTARTFTLRGAGKVSLVLDDVGNWTIEAFASRDGYLPSYYSGNVAVKPRPLKVEVLVSGLEYLFKPVFIIKTTPPVTNATITLRIRSMLLEEGAVLYTNSSGIAAFEPLILPFPATLEVVAQARGYERTLQSLRYDNTWVLAAYLLVAAVILVVFSARRFRRRAWEL